MLSDCIPLSATIPRANTVLIAVSDSSIMSDDNSDEEWKDQGSSAPDDDEDWKDSGLSSSSDDEEWNDPGSSSSSLSTKKSRQKAKTKTTTGTTIVADRWYEMCTALQAYKEFNGHTLVPQSHVIEDGEQTLRLGRWVNNIRQVGQREFKKQNEKKFEQLNKLGFVWQQRMKFKEWVQHLKDYKAEYGDCRVPKSYENINGLKLGRWVLNQRTEYSRKHTGKSHHITTDQINELEKLGFVWTTEKRYRVDKIKTTTTTTKTKARRTTAKAKATKVKATKSSRYRYGSSKNPANVTDASDGKGSSNKRLLSKTRPQPSRLTRSKTNSTKQKKKKDEMTNSDKDKNENEFIPIDSFHLQENNGLVEI